jgi:cyclopropane-fatty-acyl-phospholipid synthase
MQRQQPWSAILEARLLFSKTSHKRYRPVPHHFEYTVPFVLLPINQLPTLDKENTLFSYNKRNLYGLYDADYLEIGTESIEEKLRRIPAFSNISMAHIWLLTMPRFLNRVFNPISLFLVEEEGKWGDVLVEVTNTYKEKHLYFLSNTPEGNYISETKTKTFHVSPFLEEGGTYFFKISKNQNLIEVHIRYTLEKVQFYANLIEMKGFPMTDKSLLEITYKYPFETLKTMPRIIKEAAKLYYLKKIPVREKPIPLFASFTSESRTIRPMPPNWQEKIALKLILRAMKKITHGTLTLILPDRKPIRFGQDISPNVTLHIYEYKFFTALVKKGEIGLGESYMKGLWDTDDLTACLRLLLANKHNLQSKTYGTRIHRVQQWVAHWFRRNAVHKSTQNIQEHYDLSTDFYRLFLDKEMHYSSALFLTGKDSLEDAQTHKVDRLISELRIKPHHHVLEIGSGWGATAIRMAQKTGCKVTTLTLSQTQYDEVTKRIKAANLEKQISVYMEDYRHHIGSYDRILSIEMIEAVGYAYLPIYFKTLERCLSPNGIVALQAITVSDQRYTMYRRRRDWIQTHIFPGGHLPSLGHIQSILAKDSDLIIDNVKNIAASYAKTLQEWQRRFLERRQDVMALGFDAVFIRKWQYYLSYCEAGFAERYIGTLQLTLTRPLNKDLVKEDALFFDKK